ncbi:variant erythrocyte surface antigen-1 family protein [Babesia divergens]|uniref:Variant erythrocyte surface antigen-1 family protein n=1 Tax=Babesia divergens TaxID=32595 RepID=A0AAD9LD86_BABDI|nr:variant erythrocyte surface antigen-1 family protein [Babesia divergens]
MARLVCYMYYTDVFVGHNNINNLKKALNVELKDSVNSIDLTQLVHGLCLFMGYPSCLCKPKKSVEESLKKISEELKEELENYECSFISISNSDLNCNSSCKSTSDVVCKCCVLDCISKVQSSCGCVTTNKDPCTCSKDDPKRCCKDLLEKLKASLSLLNLKADMEKLCSCTDDCCKNGECTQGDSSGCSVCNSLQTPNDYTVTGLGLLRPSPIRLAERLNEFFGTGSTGQKPGCACTCGSGPGQSCCCLACDTGKCSASCNSECLKGSPGQCGHTPKSPSDCPRQKFCIAINGIKIAAQARDRTCCESGQKCHCGLGSGSNCNSGNCCIEKVGNSTYKHSLKCLLRRVVKFFKDLSLDPSSSLSGRSRICCELVCVVKTCYFIKDFYNKNGQTFKKALQTLQYSGPCGHELYRLIDGFLQGCVFPVAGLDRNDIIEKIKAAQNSCSQCSSASSKQSSPCDCCSKSGTPCLACTSLLEDPSLKTLFLHGYVSSYDSSKASWPSLPSSTSGSKCCGSSGSSSPPCSQCQDCSSSSSCPSKCCPDCPQKKAAKIFLGMLPCLYYGLKIVFDRCDPANSELWPGWQTKITEGSIVNFLFAWGIHSYLSHSTHAVVLPVFLGNLFTPDSTGSFDTLYNFVSQKYFSKTLPSSPCSSSCPSPSGSSSHVYPSTVRQILLWLSGLPFSKGFSALLSHSKGLCPPSEKSLNSDEFLYCIHATCFFLPVSVISAIQRPEKDKSFLPSTSDWTSFCYPSDSSALADMFFDYIRKVYIALDFLKFQCGKDKDKAGWRDCAFGQSCVTALQSSLKSPPAPAPSPSECCPSSLPKGILCTSVPGHYNVHEHCINGKTCIGLKPCTDTTKDANSKKPTDAHTSGKCDTAGPCPHPLLMFLIDGSDSQSKPQASSYSLFKLPKDSSVPPMGFSPDKLPTPGRHGRELHDVLQPFCTNGFYPLTRLLKFLTRISFHPPETLGEFFLFFKKLAEALDSGPLKDSFPQYVDGEPGFYSGGDLKKALEDLYGSSHSSGDHSVASLFSLSSCHANKGSNATCGPYLYPLAQDASDNLAEDLVDSYLSWICHLTPKFKSLLEEFRGKFSSCCSSCQNIVKCPCALATLYSQGFVYYSPSGLGCWNSWGEEHGQRGGGVQKHNDETNADCTRKTCKNFIDQLGKVVDSDSPLSKLLSEIEKFLWSIRKPFFLFILAFWAFVSSYFLYVQLYKLDLLHLKSHAHFSRSFKILPSTLFSDASSKLKDLSYFTL